MAMLNPRLKRWTFVDRQFRNFSGKVISYREAFEKLVILKDKKATTCKECVTKYHDEMVKHAGKIRCYACNSRRDNPREDVEIINIPMRAECPFAGCILHLTWDSFTRHVIAECPTLQRGERKAMTETLWREWRNYLSSEERSPAYYIDGLVYFLTFVTDLSHRRLNEMDAATLAKVKLTHAHGEFKDVTFGDLFQQYDHDKKPRSERIKVYLGMAKREFFKEKGLWDRRHTFIMGLRYDERTEKKEELMKLSTEEMRSAKRQKTNDA